MGSEAWKKEETELPRPGRSKSRQDGYQGCCEGRRGWSVKPLPGRGAELRHRKGSLLRKRKNTKEKGRK